MAEVGGGRGRVLGEERMGVERRTAFPLYRAFEAMIRMLACTVCKMESIRGL